MKKHYTIALALITSFLAITGIQTAKAQTTIYYQSFDSSSNLPTGWLAYRGISSITSQDTLNLTESWQIDNTGTNSSYTPNGTDGYAGASGLNNCVIKNIYWTNPSIPAFYILTTGDISTYNWKNITAIWGARATKHYYDDGSQIYGFYFSTDDGATWDSIPYTENAGTSLWFLDNNATPIALPASANYQSHIMFKWIAQVYVTNSGTFRIDDFTVAGDTSSNPTAVEDIQNKPSALVYVIGNSAINIVAKDLNDQNLTVELFDMVGKCLRREEMTSSTLSLNATSLSSGIYLVKVSNGAASEITKVSITR